jgi:hypothetical protein
MLELFLPRIDKKGGPFTEKEPFHLHETIEITRCDLPSIHLVALPLVGE